MNLLHAVLGFFALQVHPVAEIDSIVRRGIDDGVFPGAVVVVGTADTILFSHGFGGLTWTDGPTPSPDSTRYDLASLTKVVGTTSAALILIERGMLRLDDSVVSYLPGFGDSVEKGAVTVRHLLAHRSGLRAFLPLHTMTETADEAKRRVLTEPLRWAVGSRVEYSDLNAMLLGWIVEEASGMDLSAFVDSAVFDGLAMDNTSYGVSPAEKHLSAPINVWRGHPIAGVVHDQNAERLGGAAGHAGLYSTGNDVARLAQLYLSRGIRADTTVVASELIETFTARGPGNRALGWEMKDTTTADNAGNLFSSDAFGHTGFTGTSLWIDPLNDVFVVLLTNRVMAPRHPRSITALKRIRGSVADSAVRLRNHACRMTRIAEGAATC